MTVTSIYCSFTFGHQPNLEQLWKKMSQLNKTHCVWTVLVVTPSCYYSDLHNNVSVYNTCIRKLCTDMTAMSRVSFYPRFTTSICSFFCDIFVNCHATSAAVQFQNKLK